MRGSERKRAQGERADKSLARAMNELENLKTISSLLFACCIGIANAGVAQQINYLAHRVDAHARNCSRILEGDAPPADGGD
jgi:hypothetical protein